jgi:hypothetical protein
MPDSIKTTRIALIVAAGLEFATAALLVFIFLAGAALVGFGTERAGLLGSALLGATGIVLALGFVAFGIVDLVIAAGIAKGRPWARIAGSVIGVIYLIAIPVGTILGIIMLIGLLGRDARDWFSTGVPLHRDTLVPPPTVLSDPLFLPSALIPSIMLGINRQESTDGETEDH